jgi:hypothetical protein
VGQQRRSPLFQGHLQTLHFPTGNHNPGEPHLPIKQTINAQIAVFRGWTADVIGLVGPLDMQGIGIRVGINRDGLDAHAACGFNHAAGNFTTVGDQYFARHD